MSKETKQNYCGLVILSGKLRFVCTNSQPTVWNCKYKKTHKYQTCSFNFENAEGLQLCNCTRAQKRVIVDFALSQVI